ncbi:MAG TPA: citrate/2-methylcitrate synthase [Nitrospirota bacterium]|nr:citrate/2-methylcitrate synthase [Nitrospirota bacterium]
MVAKTQIGVRTPVISGDIKTKNIGLRGVKVADTKISDVDGENGILIYRGYRIEELARNSSFEETAYLLLYDALPTEEQLKEFLRRLSEARKLPRFVVESMKRLPHDSQPMDVLQAAIPLLAMADPELTKETRESNLSKAIRLIARIAEVVAAWQRIRQGLKPLPADETLSHAANFLWQMSGIKPDPETAKDFDTALVLHADHSFNASTFACREVVSTQAHMYAGVAAGVGALSGNLHGGANEQVMKMLIELQEEKDVAGWVRNQLESGRKIMGMGHAVYKTTDPRAKFLKEMGRRIGKKLGQEQWYRLLTEVEETAVAELEKRGRTTIKPNVDFYSAPVYHMMGVPLDLMTPVFAVARIAGWTAHIIEEKFGDAQKKPALYRPSSEYVGNYCGRTGCAYTPVTQRK